MPVATIPTAGIVTLIAVAVAVFVLAAYLIAIGIVLRKVSAGLNVVISAVGQIPGATEPVEGALTSINRDLGAARDVLEGLLIKKLGALPEQPRAEPTAEPSPFYERAADQSPDPPADPTAERSPFYERAAEHPPDG